METAVEVPVGAIPGRGRQSLVKHHARKNIRVNTRIVLVQGVYWHAFAHKPMMLAVHHALYNQQAGVLLLRPLSPDEVQAITTGT